MKLIRLDGVYKNYICGGTKYDAFYLAFLHGLKTKIILLKTLMF